MLRVGFETLELMQLYRASDALMAHREAFEHHLFERAMDLFDLHPTVTLYDLTNTYFEGEARGQAKALRGHSKDKRTDCPLLTLGLVLDASAFVRRSQVFAGNVREHYTLADSLKSELGLRPSYHHKPIRADGHLFITVSAYQLVQVLRTRLRQAGENSSWTTLRRTLEAQQRITATFRRADGRTLHVRKATRAEPPQQAIYDALGIDAEPGGIRKNIV